MHKRNTIPTKSDNEPEFSSFNNEVETVIFYS